VNSIEKLIAKWRAFAATTFPYGTADNAERRGILGAERQRAREDADELEQALARESAAPANKEPLIVTLKEKLHERFSEREPSMGKWDEPLLVACLALDSVFAARSSERDAPAERWTCPDCGYDSMPYPPKDYHICPKCMVEFGNDDRKTKLLGDRDAVRREALEEAAWHRPVIFSTDSEGIITWCCTEDHWRGRDWDSHIRALAASPAGRASEKGSEK